MDEFKKLVENNREQFDIYESNYDDLWDGVKNEIKTQRSTWIPLKIAAAILLMITFGGLLYQLQFNGDYVSSELAEAEAEYLPIIEEKTKMVMASYPQMDTILWDDLNKIDQALSELRIDLKDEVDNEEVIYAMIENYSIKLSFLERILEEVKKEENVQNTTI